jgi:quinol-cytochrome oxidoreductase complex cytochrome b subunit
MNLVSAVGLLLVVALFVRQLRRNPGDVSPGRRYLFDGLFVVYALALAGLSAAGYIEAIDPVEKTIYVAGIGAGALLIIALGAVRWTPLGRWVVRA